MLSFANRKGPQIPPVTGKINKEVGASGGKEVGRKSGFLKKRERE